MLALALPTKMICVLLTASKHFLKAAIDIPTNCGTWVCLSRSSVSAPAVAILRFYLFGQVRL